MNCAIESSCKIKSDSNCIQCPMNKDKQSVEVDEPTSVTASAVDEPLPVVPKTSEKDPSNPNDLIPSPAINLQNIPEKLTTKERKKYEASIKDNLRSNNAWLFRGLMAIYKYQTEEEKVVHSTHKTNNVGFTKFDAEFLTAMAKKHEVNANFTEKMTNVTRKKMMKYAGQLLRIARGIQ